MSDAIAIGRVKRAEMQVFDAGCLSVPELHRRKPSTASMLTNFGIFGEYEEQEIPRASVQVPRFTRAGEESSNLTAALQAL